MCFRGRSQLVDKKELELFLEKTMEIVTPREELEQYTTPASIASQLLWEAFIRGDVTDKTILDLGCGSLRLGVGALFLGARRIVGVDIDMDLLIRVKEWLKRRSLMHKVLLIVSDASAVFLKNIDTTIMNPPFGVKPWSRGIDLVFLKKALLLSKNVYSIHKDSWGLKIILKDISKAFNRRLANIIKTKYPIKMILKHHRRKVYWINVILVVLKSERR